MDNHTRTKTLAKFDQEVWYLGSREYLEYAKSELAEQKRIVDELGLKPEWHANPVSLRHTFCCARAEMISVSGPAEAAVSAAGTGPTVLLGRDGIAEADAERARIRENGGEPLVMMLVDPTRTLPQRTPQPKSVPEAIARRRSRASLKEQLGAGK